MRMSRTEAEETETQIQINGLMNALNELNLISNGIYNNEVLKRIDFVLVFRTKDESGTDARQIFESNLVEEGLVLEYKDSIGEDAGLTFVQIFAPWDLLTRYAEVMKLRMPMKTIQSNMKILFDLEFADHSMTFTAPYSRGKEYLFDIPEQREDFFTSSQRAQIVEFILKRKSFSQNANDVFSIGINKLLQDGVYLAAFPLHEGKLNEDIDSVRHRLIDDWASLRSIYKNQPLERIVQYFGVKIAMYFAWVGFYTKMLIPASIVGLMCFIYGMVTVGWDVPTKQLCNSTNLYMCTPKSCKNCEYTTLDHSCPYMKASYLMDNPATVVFAIFMSLWATFYLEMWKRYSAKITYKWDLSDFDKHEEYPRPEYLATLASRNAKRKINVITRMEEPYVPFLRGKLPHLIVSSSLVLLCIVLAIIIMLSIIAYRVSFKVAIETYRLEFIHTYGSIIVSLTAALINLVVILIFDRFYTKLAFYLTEKELPRTQFEFDNSLTLKMFLFQFVNYYSSIFYIAFFKGTFTGHPGQVTSLIHEECPVGGCFLELCIQLGIIMVGKQAFGAIIEVITPICTRLYNKWKYTQSLLKEKGPVSLPQWEEDYLLESWDHTSLFYEYLELVLQFGFVTIFVSAFPLAPLFALINNVFEIRFDAKKIITSFQRPVAQRVKSIGIWYRILDAIGKLSVITNAMLIAFTTSFVPRLMYFFEHGDFNNYLNSTLSIFPIDDKNVTQHINATTCVYVGYREKPGSADEYDRTEYFWHLMVARLAFVVVFENVIVMLTSLMRVLIPDVPKDLRQQKRWHSYLTNELVMRHELRICKRANSQL